MGDNRAGTDEGDIVEESAVLALGNFDGVHRGHQALIAAARSLATEAGRASALLTFEPHPRQFFQPDTKLFRLTPPDLKADLARWFGVARVEVLAFDAELSQLTAQDFLDDILGRRMRAAGIVVGHDFRFGRKRGGDAGLIRDWAQARGLPVAVVEPVLLEGETVSSTAIRAALATGDVGTAAAMLGYRWLVRAPVRHGEKRGRELGYPTANMALQDPCDLAHGIYAVRARLGGMLFDGVASYGRRPTFDNGAPLLETHLFDVKPDLYGQVLDVEFVSFIRPELRFDSVEALIARMDVDSREARAALALPLPAGIRSALGESATLPLRGHFG